MKNLLYLILIPFGLGSCISYTNVESARTLGPKKTKEHSIRVKTALMVVSKSSAELEGGYLVPEYVFNKKIKNNMDWGLRIGIDANIYGNIKYQFMGNFKSKVAMSIQPEIGVGFFPNDDIILYNAPLNLSAQLPLMITYHFNDNAYFTTTPKIINMITPRGNYNLFSQSTGFGFGERVKWNISYTFTHLNDKPEAAFYIHDSAHIFEIGMKFFFKNRNKINAPSID